MPIVLGIHDGTHDAGAALIRDGKLIAACDEERFTRKKGAGGWPESSIATCLQIANTSMEDIDAIAFAGLVTPNPALRLFRQAQQHWHLDDGKFYQPKPSWRRRLADWLQFQSPFPHLRSSNAFYKPILQYALQRQSQKSINWNGPIQLFDHHRCHAAAAYFQAGFDESLVVIVDGVGDGLCATIWQGRGTSLELLGNMPYPHSYGLLYSSITGHLGFRPFRHEGKLTGLAAHGNRHNVDVAFPFTGEFPNRHFTQQYPLHNWLKKLSRFCKEDICAWLQHGLEQEITGLINYYLQQTGLQHLALAGGVFANVRLNQAISEQCPIKDVFIFPNMGDAGLSVGAALCLGNKQWKWPPTSLNNVFLGMDISEGQITTALQGSGMQYRLLTQPSQEIATLLAQGKIVARCSGRMEYGPRALGNRSILADPGNPLITKRLNKALQRSDFMPFAPIIASDSLDEYLEWKPSIYRAMQFMTITVQAKSSLSKLCPAIVHVDGSLRPQIITKENQPELWEILSLFQQQTGRPALINTSFNIHEEPIIAQAEEAIRAVQKAKLDVLILGRYLVTAR